MRATWVQLIISIVMLAGCRNRTAELKPQTMPDVLSVPPVGDRRYDTPNYPKEAFNYNKNDPMQQMPRNGGTGPGPIMPAGMGPGGMMGGPGY